MDAIENNQIKQYIVIKLGKEQYGINIQNVQNIVRMMKITRVPKAPYFINGVINLRGEIIPVMSIRKKFNLDIDEYNNATRIIIVTLDGSDMGIIVDEVREVIELPEENIEIINSDINDEKGNYISGVGKVDNELVTLLNLDGLINSN